MFRFFKNKVRTIYLITHLMKFLTLLFALAAPALAQFKKITFPAADGVEITADLYRVNDALTTPMILLFHQAGSSRGEYREIAPRLGELGFNCLAIDQRSGNSRNGVVNETAGRVSGNASFLDAIPDLEAAIAKAKESYASGPVIIWGSSYSSVLVLKLIGEQPALADGVLSFSPGEYLGAGNPVRTAATQVNGPTFITSAANERSASRPIFDAIPSSAKTYFLPESGGVHGSSTLNAGVANQAAYWEAVTEFLKQWQVKAAPQTNVSVESITGGKVALKFAGEEGKHYRLSVSKDLKRWLSLASVTANTASMSLRDNATTKRQNLFYRAEPIAAIIQPSIAAVSHSGSPQAYQFSVSILSDEDGWNRYADWWEVLNEQGELLYRRVLGHPHENEQPFTRSGGPVKISADQIVFIRAHMNDGGYGKKAYRGSINTGFQETELSPVFGSEAAVTGSLPRER